MLYNKSLVRVQALKPGEKIVKLSNIRLSLGLLIFGMILSACDSSAVSTERSIELGNHDNINRLGTGTGNAIVKDVALYVDDKRVSESSETLSISVSATVDCRASIENLSNVIGVQIVRTLTLSSAATSLSIELSAGGISASEALSAWVHETGAPDDPESLTCQVDVFRADELLASGSSPEYPTSFTRVDMPSDEATYQAPRP